MSDNPILLDMGYYGLINCIKMSTIKPLFLSSQSSSLVLPSASRKCHLKGSKNVGYCLSVCVMAVKSQAGRGNVL